MPPRDEPPDEERIVENLPYVNELMQAIRQVNECILSGRDAEDAAHNLITDLPADWIDEVRIDVDSADKEYRGIVNYHNAFFQKGTSETQKEDARHKIYNAEKQYARNIKKIVITLLKKKELLFRTKKKIERGYLSLYELGEADSPDE